MLPRQSPPSTSHRVCHSKTQGQLQRGAFQSSKEGLFSCQIPQLGRQPPTKIKLCPKYSQKQHFPASSCEHQPRLNPTQVGARGQGGLRAGAAPSWAGYNRERLGNSARFPEGTPQIPEEPLQNRSIIITKNYGHSNPATATYFVIKPHFFPSNTTKPFKSSPAAQFQPRRCPRPARPPPKHMFWR